MSTEGAAVSAGGRTGFQSNMLGHLSVLEDQEGGPGVGGSVTTRRLSVPQWNRFFRIVKYL